MRRSTIAVALALALLTLLPAPSPVTLAKEFELDGTIDCGQAPGKLCLPVGATIGIVTDQYSHKKERVEVGMALILEQRLKRSKTGRLLLDDPRGVNRAALLTQLKPLVEQLAALDPAGMSNEEKERLVDELFDRSLPREVVSARDKLILVAQNFTQDARIRLVVSDELGPVLMATEIREYHDYLLPQGRSSGTLNLGQLTGDDSESGVCTDFVEEFLDFAKERIQDRGKFELTNNEELFFELASELPNPCYNAERQVTATVTEWIRGTLKATADDLRKRLEERRRQRLERLRAFLDRPGARAIVIAILRDTILKPQPEGRPPLRNILEERTR
jgi:molybdopterin converting factor small subunit